MTKEEAMKNIQEILDEATEEEDSVCYVTSNDAEALQMGIEALKAQEWIPCSERLPKIYIPVILSGKHNEVIGYRRNDSDWMAFTGDGWETDIEHPEDFIAWMPLPESYKEDGEDE